MTMHCSLTVSHIGNKSALEAYPRAVSTSFFLDVPSAPYGDTWWLACCQNINVTLEALHHNGGGEVHFQWGSSVTASVSKISLM